MSTGSPQIPMTGAGTAPANRSPAGAANPRRSHDGRARESRRPDRIRGTIARPAAGARGGTTMELPVAPPPRVWHASAIPHALPGREAIASALAIVAAELRLLAATFFLVGVDGEVSEAVVEAPGLPAAEMVREVCAWMALLRGVDPLAPRRLPRPLRPVVTLRDAGDGRALLADPLLRSSYRRLDVVDDARLLVRDGDRLLGGIALWRPLGSRPWTPGQVRRLRALQPLVEVAYLAARRHGKAQPPLPPTLTRRQREVAQLLAGGATNDEVARALHVTRNTAKSHTRAVLRKLGVGTRRELVLHLAQRAPAAPPPNEPGAELPPASTETARTLRSHLLAWSDGIGAAVGGCCLLSARLAPVAEACGTAAGPRERDPRAVAALHRLLVAPEILRAVAGDRAQTSVAPLDAFACGALPREVAGAIEHLGVGVPSLMALRAGGRLAGIAWLTFDARCPVDELERVRAMRRLHPLVQLAHLGTLRQAQGHPSAGDGIAALGLTAREQAVASLALAGESNAGIARQLRISPSTVKNHMTRILAKCGVRSRTQLITTFPAEPMSQVASAPRHSAQGAQ